MTKCLILSIEEWAEKKNKEKIVVEKINLKIGEQLEEFAAIWVIKK